MRCNYQIFEDKETEIEQLLFMGRTLPQVATVLKFENAHNLQRWVIERKPTLKELAKLNLKTRAAVATPKLTLHLGN